jgi:glycosyl transferase family 87
MANRLLFLRSAPWPRWLALLALGLVGILLYQRILAAGSSNAHRGDPFLWPGLGVTLIAVAGALLILRSSEARDRRARWIELGLIVAIGLALRLIFISAPPTFSYDAYRYAWDAHLVSHGVSPYSHTVEDSALISLRDGAIWPKLNWREAPTIYPPGAQVFFLLIHAIAPLNIEAVKLAMALCDLGVGVVTLLLLRQRHMDVRRVIVYWWSPIPIIEFVYNAHLDVVAVLLVALALLVAGQRWRGARALIGVLLGLAALTKLYPLLFVFALARRRDWALFASLATTLVATIAPFAALGLGSGGFLSTYFSQRYVDQGILLRLYNALILSRTLQMALLGISLLTICALTVWLRARRGLSADGAILLLSVAWIALSPHLFPWYIAAPLPFVALCLRLPVRADVSSVCACGLWLFALVMPFTYVIFAPGHNPNLFIWFFLIPATGALSSPVARAISKIGNGRKKQNSRPPATLTPRSTTLAAAQKE